jgi:hypothetical protein
MAEMVRGFNARATLLFKPDRLYRVYPDSSVLYFIRIGGQGVHWSAALRAHLGLLGGLIVAPLERREKKQLAGKTLETDRIPPQVRLPEHAHNFRLSATEITTAKILPADPFHIHGPHVGRWEVRLADGKKWNLQFEDTTDMSTAVEMLPRCLGDRLELAVEWDARKKSYRKRKMGAG